MGAEDRSVAEPLPHDLRACYRWPMAFPKQLLADHEKVVFDIKPHWIAVVPSGLWTVVAILAAFFGYRAAGDIFDGEGNTPENIFLLVVLVAWIYFAVVPFLRWRFTMFVLTSDRLITRSGILSKHSKEIPLERINDVAFSQTVLERMVGAGDLFVESAGERGQTRISDVRKPEQMQLMIYKESEENSNRMMRGGADATPPPAASEVNTAKSENIVEQIEALGRLKHQGVLSEAEFQAKKEELLKRM
ncbi:MAG: PH domain-containing protein [Actinobacteria bacterium]|nr:PH domain-containing protein [Actinomycetota bacterium]